MLSLLSRATRARCLCNCSLCIATTARVAQRTSLQKRLIRPDVFTVFSSTFVLSAAFVDGMRKDRKLQDWDQLLAKTQAEIDAVEQDQKLRLEKLNIEAIDEGQAPSDALLEGASWLTQVTWGDMLYWASVKEQERKSGGFHNAKGISLDVLKNLNDTDLARVFYDRRILSKFYSGPDCAGLESVPATHVYSPKKLRTLEWSVVKLVSKYLQLVQMETDEAKDQSEIVVQDVASLVEAKGVTPADVAEDFQSFDRRLTRLHDEKRGSDLYKNFPSPSMLSYRWSPSERKDELVEFNQDLQQTLYSIESLDGKNIKDVCRTLLNAQTASDVHTYNLLLIKFCQLRADSFVLATYQSFHECHIRPNEITHATMLRYFALTKNREAFDLYLWRMNGFRQGLAIADPERPIDPLVSSRYRSFGQETSKFAELARLNTEVYTCLLRGLIEMSRFDEAVWYFRSMIKEGWEPGMEILHTLLQSCYDAADIVSGWRIWKYMHSLCTAEEPISEDSHRLMVDLCRKCDKAGMLQWIAQQKPEESASAPSLTLLRHRVNLNVPAPHTEVEIHATAIRQALHTALNPSKLRSRFPYVAGPYIEQKLSDLLRLSLRPHMSYEYGTDIERGNKVTDILTAALNMGSYAKAQAHIHRQKFLTSPIKYALAREARSAFRILQELSELNVEAQSQSVQDDVDLQQGLFLHGSAPPDVVCQSEGHQSAVLESPDLSRTAMIAEIQKLDADIAPEAVLQAYDDFRQTTQNGLPPSKQSTRVKRRNKINPIISYVSSPSRPLVQLEAG